METGYNSLNASLGRLYMLDVTIDYGNQRIVRESFDELGEFLVPYGIFLFS